MTRRDTKAEHTRDAILDAAAEVFDEHGYAGRISQILDRAHVTSGGFYHHFRSKEELAETIIDQQFDRIEPPDSSVNPLQALIDLTFQVAHRLTDDVRVRAAIRLVIEHASFTQPLREPYQTWTTTVEALLRAAQSAGVVTAKTSTTATAQLIVGMFTGVQLTSEVLTGRNDLPDRLGDMWDLLRLTIVVPAYRSMIVWRPHADEGSAGRPTVCSAPRGPDGPQSTGTAPVPP